MVSHKGGKNSCLCTSNSILSTEPLTELEDTFKAKVQKAKDNKDISKVKGNS